MPHPSTSLAEILGTPEQISAAWRSLSDALPHRRFFHRSEYFEAALEGLFGADRSRLCALSVPGRALLPLCSKVTTFARVPQVRLLEAPNHVLMDLQDALVMPNDVDAVAALIDGLRQVAPWDVLWLPRVLAESAFLAALRRLDPPGLAIKEIQQSKSVSLIGGYPAVEARIHHKFIVNEQRKRKKLAQRGTVVHRTFHPRRADDASFVEFLRIEAAGWKGREHTTIADTPTSLAFYQQLLERFGERKQCRIDLLSVDERPIAAQFGLVVDRVLSLLKIGFDEEFHATGPGGLLLHDTLRHIGPPHDDLQELSFVTGAAWNDAWGARAQAVFDVRIHNATPLGHAALRAAQLAPYVKRAMAWAETVREPRSIAPERESEPQ